LFYGDLYYYQYRHILQPHTKRSDYYACNHADCVLLSPDRYEALMEELEDLQLMMEAERRIAGGEPVYSHAEVMQRLGITQADIDTAEDVEIE